MPSRPPKLHTYRQSPDAAVLTQAKKWQPWMVTLKYRWSSLLPPIKVQIFVRAPDQVKAMHLARKTWTLKSKGSVVDLHAEVYPEWPAMDDDCDVEVIDDQDYAQHWKEAQRYKHYWTGMQLNPLSFAYFPTGELIINV